MFGDDDPDLGRLQRRLTDAERGMDAMERDLDRRIMDIFRLNRELEEERLERIRLEGEALDLVAEVNRLRRILGAGQASELPEPMCADCGRHPDDIFEYARESTGEDLDPVDYVRQEEGTYNRDNGHFLCTMCYINAGQPSAAGGWVAP